MTQGRLNTTVQEGTVIVFSDCHYWPGLVSTAHRALVKFAKVLKPQTIVANGDVIDGARISKHARIGWQNAPKLVDELEAATERLREVSRAAPKALLFWPLGNHDARFETYLANHAGEYAGVKGFSLKEHFPEWEPCWKLTVNGNTAIQHRWKGGINATINNVKLAGRNIVTGHLHAARTSPYTDLNGTRYGVDSGTMADPEGPQFLDYTEATPLDWRSAFSVLTYDQRGKLMWPEHVVVVDEQKHTVFFRGQIVEV